MFGFSLVQISIGVVLVAACAGVFVWASRLPPTIVEVIRVLSRSRHPLTCAEITKSLGKRATLEHTQTLLNELRTRKDVECGAGGRYRLTELARERESYISIPSSRDIEAL